MPRKHDGWSIKEIITAYKCRIVSVKQDLTQNKKNKYLNKVIESERNGIIRITNDFFKIFIHSMQDWTATTRHGGTKRLKHTGNLLRKNLMLKDVC